MCQLFALNSHTPSAATFSFTGLSARGGLTGDHVDGFGMVQAQPMFDPVTDRILFGSRNAVMSQNLQLRLIKSW